MTARPDPNYDVLSLLPAGVLLTRTIEEGLAAAYLAGGYVPLTQAQIIAVTGPALPLPADLPRFADSNPDPMAAGLR